MEIPQTVISKRGAIVVDNDDAKISSDATKKKRREDATVVATTQVQGMVWIHPSLTPLEALSLMEEGKLSPPPRIPEVDLPGYRTTVAVRDFPIDWTVLMENIME